MNLKEKDFEIFRNKRPAENVFTNEKDCCFCDEFVPQVIVIPFTSYANNLHGLRICKTCLNTMIEALDKNMRNHFESDFQERDNA